MGTLAEEAPRTPRGAGAPLEPRKSPDANELLESLRGELSGEGGAALLATLRQEATQMGLVTAPPPTPAEKPPTPLREGALSLELPRVKPGDGSLRPFGAPGAVAAPPLLEQPAAPPLWPAFDPSALLAGALDGPTGQPELLESLRAEAEEWTMLQQEVEEWQAAEACPGDDDGREEEEPLHLLPKGLGDAEEEEARSTLRGGGRLGRLYGARSMFASEGTVPFPLGTLFGEPEEPPAAPPPKPPASPPSGPPPAPPKKKEGVKHTKEAPAVKKEAPAPPPEFWQQGWEGQWPQDMPPWAQDPSQWQQWPQDGQWEGYDWQQYDGYDQWAQDASQWTAPSPADGDQMLQQLAADNARMENLLLGMLTQEQITQIFGQAATRQAALTAQAKAAPKVKPLDNRRLDDPKPPKLAAPVVTKVARQPLHELNRPRNLRELVSNGAPVPQLHQETGGVSVLYAPLIMDLGWGDLEVRPAEPSRRAAFDYALREPAGANALMRFLGERAPNAPKVQPLATLRAVFPDAPVVTRASVAGSSSSGSPVVIPAAPPAPPPSVAMAAAEAAAASPQLSAAASPSLAAVAAPQADAGRKLPPGTLPSLSLPTLGPRARQLPDAPLKERGLAAAPGVTALSDASTLSPDSPGSSSQLEPRWGELALGLLQRSQAKQQPPPTALPSTDLGVGDDL